jgi:RNA-binding protein
MANMTSKQRAQLRREANQLEAVFHIGKGGVTEAVAAQMLEDFRTRELLKGKVLLESAPQPPSEAAAALAAMTGADVVQVVGGSIVFFKENPELHRKKRQTGGEKHGGRKEQNRKSAPARRTKPKSLP